MPPVPFPRNHDDRDKRLLNRTRCHGWKATTTSPTTQVDGIGWSAVTWSSNLGETTIFCRELNKVFFHVFCWFIVFVGGFWRENQVILPKVGCYFFLKFLLLHTRYYMGSSDRAIKKTPFSRYTLSCWLVMKSNQNLYMVACCWW